MAGIKDAVREVAKSQQTDDIIIKTDRNTQVRVSCIRDDTVFRNLSFCQGKRWRYVDRGSATKVSRICSFYHLELE